MSSEDILEAQHARTTLVMLKRELSRARKIVTVQHLFLFYRDPAHPILDPGSCYRCVLTIFCNVRFFLFY